MSVNVAPRVSVVIPSHNCAPYLAQCVESAVAQTFAALEIVIVDDASTDGSRELAHSLAQRYGHHRSVRVLEEHARRSSITRNTGIAHARGEYILNLDADNFIDPRYAELLVAALDSEPRAAVAYGTWQVFGERSGTFAPQPWDVAKLVRQNYIDANSLFRRSAWEQVGGFATDVRYEDWDLWLRFVDAGYTGVPVPAAVFHYRVRSDGQNIANAGRNTRIRAEFIRRRPHLYTSAEQEWAARVLEDAGEPGALPAERGRPVRPASHSREPAPARAVLAFVAVPPGRPEPGALIDALRSDGVDAIALTPGAGDFTAFAEQAAREAGAEWIVALNPDERCTSPWPDLDLGEAIAFLDSLGYDALTGESADGAPSGRLVAWRLGPRRYTVSPLPLLLAPAHGPAPSDAQRAAVLARGSRDLMIAGAIRGGHAATAPTAEDLARWATRTAGLPRPVEVDVIQAAMTAIESGAQLEGLDAAELALLLAAARLREAEVRARNEPGGADPAIRLRVAGALADALAQRDAGALDARTFATLVHADDLIAQPAIGAAYAAAFSAGDDATLVVYDVDDDADALVERLSPALGEAGLEDPSAPDLLGVSVTPAQASALTAHADALLAASSPSGPFSELPRFAPDAVDALRRLAELRWSAAGSSVA